MGFDLPTANMRTKLQTPVKQPRWATDSGAILEPAEGQKDTGWTTNKKAPARWMNWLQGLLTGWAQLVGATLVANYSKIINTVTVPFWLIWHPDNKLWMGTRVASTTTYSSITGYQWGATAGALSGQAVGSGEQVDSLAIDSNYFIIGCSNGDINYSTNGVSWTTVTSATIGGTGDIDSICTKYPNDDMVIALRSDGTVRIANDVTSSWSTPTTPPTVKARPRRILYLGGTTWAALLCDTLFTNAILSISTDDGDTWNTSAADPSATDEFWDMAYCPDTGRIVIAGGLTGGNTKIQYTDDLGTTWVTATQSDGLSLDDHFLSVYCCGGGLWVAVGEYTTANLDRPQVQMSKDNGATWRLVNIIEELDVNTADYSGIGCDGKKVLIAPNAGGQNMLRSLSLG